MEPKFPLPVHEWIAQREILRHTYQGRIHHALTVGMVVAADVTGDLGTFAIRPRCRKIEVAKGRQNTAVHGFKAVSGRRARARLMMTDIA